jgi:hypothetical protein
VALAHFLQGGAKLAFLSQGVAEGAMGFREILAEVERLLEGDDGLIQAPLLAKNLSG